MTDRYNLSPVEESELLARFIYTRRHLKNDGTISYHAFLPNPHTNDVSVFRYIGLKSEEIIEIGKSIATIRNNNFHGSADIIAKHIFDVELDIEPTKEPYNHANIINWPTTKDEQMDIAQVLASKAILKR